MYYVKYGNEWLHDPEDEERILLDLNFESKNNSCGFCDFTIEPIHPLHSVIKERDSLNPVEVFDGYPSDDTRIFSGFIYDLGADFQLAGKVKCKGALAYLEDSICRPYSTVDNGFGDKAPPQVNLYFEWLIEQHNRLSDGSKQFRIGVNQGADLEANNYIFRESTIYPSTWEEITDKILEPLGGYITVYKKNGEYYINLYSNLSDKNSQILEFGTNLMDFTRNKNAENLVTALIPLGSSMSETAYEYNEGYFKTKDEKPDTDKQYYLYDSETKEYNATSVGEFEYGVTYYEWTQMKGYFVTSDTTPSSKKRYYIWNGSSYVEVFLVKFEAGKDYYEYNANFDESDKSLTIKGLDSGYVPGFRINDDYIYNEEAVKKYGFIFGKYENSDLTTKETLAYYGAVNLASKMAPEETLEIKAVDLHYINPDIKPIRVGEYVRVRSKPHNVDAYFLCSEIDLNLNQPEQSVYTLGVAYDTLTGQQSSIASSLNKSINSKADAVSAISEEAKAATEKIQMIVTEMDIVSDVAYSSRDKANTANDIAVAVRDKIFCEVNRDTIDIVIEPLDPYYALNEEYIVGIGFGQKFSGGVYTNAKFNSSEINYKINPIHVPTGVDIVFVPFTNDGALEQPRIIFTLMAKNMKDTPPRDGIRPMSYSYEYYSGGAYTYKENDYIEFEIVIDDEAFKQIVYIFKKNPNRKTWYVDDPDSVYVDENTGVISFTLPGEASMYDVVVYDGKAYTINVSANDNTLTYQSTISSAVDLISEEFKMMLYSIANSKLLGLDTWDFGYQFAAYGWGSKIYIETLGIDQLLNGDPVMENPPTSATIVWNGSSYTINCRNFTFDTTGHTIIFDAVMNGASYSGWNSYDFHIFFDKHIIVKGQPSEFVRLAEKIKYRLNYWSDLVLTADTRTDLNAYTAKVVSDIKDDNFRLYNAPGSTVVTDAAASGEFAIEDSELTYKK